MARGGSRYGAGRPGLHVKAEHCLRLDVRDLARRKLLGGMTFRWRWTNTATGEEVGAIGVRPGSGNVQLSYSHNDMPISTDVRIEYTPCHYGGARPWFSCPRCGRRVAVLFLRSGWFMCRHCGRVVYASQAEDALGRTWRRQSKLEGRLGEDCARPKGMHHTTRERILDGIWQCEELRENALAVYLSRLGFQF